MSGFAVKGWCPDACHPMMAGDGLLLRVRPRLGRLTTVQVLGLCDVASVHGNGLIDMTSRANLQLRGIGEGNWRAAIDRLVALDLVDADPFMEGRRAVLVAPDWRAGDDTHRIAKALLGRLGGLPDLPAKMGFAIDAGADPVLNDTPADFRIERGASGGLILRADGRKTGVALAPGGEAEALIALAQWFAESGGTAAGRMARYDAPLPGWATGTEHPAAQGLALTPGRHALGAAYGLPFGRIEARQLIAAVTASASPAVRITPWRVMLFESADPQLIAGFLHDPADPALRIDACPGMPACPQATVETRDLALRLAPHVTGRLHVSGCAKGCARAGPADVVLTGRDGLFDLVRNARASDPPDRSSLIPAQILAQILAHFESRLMPYTYETDGAAIYRQSFATIRTEADLTRFHADDESIAVRMIHAAGMVDLARYIHFSAGFGAAARAALAGGAPILCDARMVSEGVTQARLPAHNPVICTLHDTAVPDMARAMGNTRSAAALELWRPHLAGAMVAIGNAPTALFHLLNMLQDPACPRPAAIIGCPVGFVGAMESKAALWTAQPVPCVIVEGRLGGSAITVAAINAIASRAE